MPHDQADQSVAQQTGETVFEELCVLMRDVRAWLEAWPVSNGPVSNGPVSSDIVPAARGSVGADWGGSVSDMMPESSELNLAVSDFNARADTVSATVERAAQAVRERGDRIDATLAEIRRIRAQTVPS